MHLKIMAEEVAGCRACVLWSSRTNTVFGMGNPEAGLMFVGEGPGAEEDKQGLPFVGRSGKLLDRVIGEEMGIDRSGCYIANVVKCRPPNNRDPLPDEIAACRRFLHAQVDLIEPKVIVTLGRFSTQELLGTSDPIGVLRGKSFDYRGAHLVPTLHPAAVLRGGGEAMAKFRSDIVRAKLLLKELL